MGGAGNRRRGAARREYGGNETASDRFEFARRHIVHVQKLEQELHDAVEAVFAWTHYTAEGEYILQPDIGKRLRRPKTPEEREHLKALNAKVTELRAKLLLAENDGRDL